MEKQGKNDASLFHYFKDIFSFMKTDKKPTIDLSKNSKVKQPLEIVRGFMKNSSEIEVEKQAEIERIDKQIADNKSAIGKITACDGKLGFFQEDDEIKMFVVYNGKKEKFTYNSLIPSKTDDSFVVDIIKKYISDDSAKLKKIINRENDIKARLESIKPVKDSKIKKFFCQFIQLKKDNEREEYDKQIKSLRKKLYEVKKDREDVEFQLDYYKDMLQNITVVNKFCKSLSSQQKDEIKEKYRLVKTFFNKNKNLEKQKAFIGSFEPSLFDYVEDINVPGGRNSLRPILSEIENSLSVVKDKSANIEHITDYVDFGSDNEVINVFVAELKKAELKEKSKHNLKKKNIKESDLFENEKGK